MSATTRTKTWLSVLALTAASLSVLPDSSFAGRNDNNGGSDNTNRNDNRDRNNNNNNNRDNANSNRDNANRNANANNGARNPNAATPRAGVPLSDSTPARLNVYRDTYRQAAAVIAVQNQAANDLIRLQNLSDRQRAAEFPRGGYVQALRDATARYQQSTAEAQRAQADIQAALMNLTGGRELSPQDLAELHAMLGL